MNLQGPPDSRYGQWLYLMAESAQEAMLAVEDDVIRYANQAAHRLLGAPAAETLTGAKIGKFLEADTLVRLSAVPQLAESFAGHVCRADGERIDISLRRAPLGDSGALFALYLSPALKESDVDWRLSQAVESAPNGVVMIDSKGRITLVNAELERMFGYVRADLLGQLIETLLPQRYRAGHVAMRAGYWQDPRPRAMGAGRELFGLRADGTEFPVEIGLNSVDTPQGRMVLAAIVDISARKRLESTFQKIVEAAPYGMLMADADGNIVLCNARIERMFGYSRSELLGRALEMLLPERYRKAHVAFRGGFYGAPSLREMGKGRDLMALHKDGSEFPVEIGLNPVEGTEGMRVLAAVVDISVRKKMELDLRQANANLEEFTYVASHDLKSPIRGIGDLVEWIAEDLGDQKSPEVQRNLERVSIRVKRMERIIEDLLAYAHAGRAPTNIEAIEPRALIQSILDVQPPSLGFEVTVDVRAAAFKAARTPLETVLRNLIGNAIKHHDREQGRLEIRVEEDDLYCVFSISDDGPGIPVKAQERVFRMFQTLSTSEREGSGIGLALTKRLVETHGGRIMLESRDGARGATFRFWWPRFERRNPNE